MSGSKMFKLPEKTDTKMKWKDMWGSTLPSKTDEKTKVVDTKTGTLIQILTSHL
jgi:hypothetical protein